jgi:hypothetical protein
MLVTLRVALPFISSPEPSFFEPSLNRTRPVGTLITPMGLTVAVNVTGCPYSEDFAEDVIIVCVRPEPTTVRVVRKLPPDAVPTESRPPSNSTSTENTIAKVIGESRTVYLRLVIDNPLQEIQLRPFKLLVIYFTV